MKRQRNTATMLIAALAAILASAYAAAEERAARVPAAGVGLARNTQNLIPAVQSPQRSERDVLPPTNDDCANAIPLMGEALLNIPWNNASATDDGPVPSCQRNAHRNVWFSWTAPIDGRAFINLCDSPLDTVLSVYEGIDCSDLTEIACDDDGCSDGTQSQVEFDATAGNTYLISIAGWDNHSGVGELNLWYGTPPQQGACCVGGACAGTMLQDACYAQGGYWIDGAECPNYVCGSCSAGEDKVEVSIRFDEHPEQITWELVDETTGAVIGSGGPYVAGRLTASYGRCLAHDGCYTFVLYDSAGDGLTPLLGNWYLRINGSVYASGDAFDGESVSARFGGGCPWPTGACCLAEGVCIDNISENDCDTQAGVFSLDEDCTTHVCEYWSLECPSTSLHGQRPAPSGMLQPSSTLTQELLSESFSNLGGTIHGIHWWGAWVESVPGGPALPCADMDKPVKIKFCMDSGGRPGAVVNEYTLVPTHVTTGLQSNGTPVTLFSVDMLIPPCDLTTGWVSIQGISDDPDCQFRWLTSNDGDRRCMWTMTQYNMTMQRPYDLAFCLDSAYDLLTGACCDDATGQCTDGVEVAYCLGRFEAGVECDNMNPPCGQPDGACCYPDATCEILVEAACTGNWLGAWSACDACPCIVPCPANAVLEAETCGETTNDGCHMGVPAFSPITPGVPVFGTVWAEGGVRDTDWYEITTTESMEFTWLAEGETDDPPLLVGLVATDPLGTPDCSTATSFAVSAIGGACQPTGGTLTCLPAGTYWFYVSVAGFEGLPCGANNHYLATLTAEPCTMIGACCYDDGYSCIDNSEAECDSLGGEWGIFEACETHKCLITCPQAAVDVEVLTDNAPAAIRWEIVDSLTGDVVASQGPYETQYHLYTERICVSPDRCYTFTIYDEYGDGICCYGGDGYYKVFYQGVLVRSGGEFAVSESCDMGPNCTSRSWACCVAGDCVGDLTNVECDALGGTWNPEISCSSGFDCSGQVDFKLTAPVVDVESCTCHAGDDCSTFAGDDHEYLITIPEDGVWTFSLAGSFWGYYDAALSLYVGTSPCSADLGVDCRFKRQPATVTVPLTAGDYYVTIDGSREICGRYILNVAKVEGCDPECPAGATPEGEPECYDGYVDMTDHGCDVEPPLFIPISCGETICGAVGSFITDGQLRHDTDWYQIDLPAATNLKWDVQATFDAKIEIWRGSPSGCKGAYAIASTIGRAYAPTTVAIDVDAGTYWLLVTPGQNPALPAADLYVACGSEYAATAVVSPNVCICGDLNNDNVVDYDDYVIFLSAMGGPVDGDPAQDAACDFDNSGAVGLADYSAWLDCYRDFIGDPFSGPPSAPGTPTPTLGGQGGLKKKSLPAAGAAEAAQPAAGSSQASGVITKLSR